MGKRAIKKPKARTDLNFEGLNSAIRGSKSFKNPSMGLPLNEGTGYDKADSTPLKKKPNLEQVADIQPDTSQGDI